MSAAADARPVLESDRFAQGQPATRERLALGATTNLVVYGATAAYALVFGAFSFLHLRNFGYARLDLGDMVQAVWSTAHGRFLESTTVEGLQLSRLAGHSDPFLALLAPLWWLWPSPVLLLVLQVAAVSAGALPVYWLARKHLGSGRAGAHFALAYLLYPATQYNAFTPAAGFHPVSIALPLILYAIWFLDEERLIPFVVTALLAASTKEEIGIAVGCLGLWYAIAKGRRRAGGVIFLTGAGITIVNFLVIIPHFAPAGRNAFADRYADIGGTPSGILHTALTDPAALVGAIASSHKAVYVALLLLPFLGFWLLEPLLVLGAVPDLVVNLLSEKPAQTTLHFQYTAGIAPFVIAATILGAARLRRDPDQASLCVLAGVAAIAFVSPILISRGDVTSAFRADPVRTAKHDALALIPDSVPAAASNGLAGSLSDRRYIYIFPYVRKAKWIVVDKNDPSMRGNDDTLKGFRRSVHRFEKAPSWRVVFGAHGVEVLRRLSRSSG